MGFDRALSLGTPILMDSTPLYRGRYNRHSTPRATRKEASFDTEVGRPFCTNVQRLFSPNQVVVWHTTVLSMSTRAPVWHTAQIINRNS
jgi:hypothetical protein